MATTVGSHSVASFTAPINGTSPIDANAVRNNDNALRTAYVAHDADTGIHLQSGLLSGRPVAATQGRKWLSVDSVSAPTQVQLNYDGGSAWYALNYFPGAVTVAAGGIAVTGNSTITGTLGGVTTLTATGMIQTTVLTEQMRLRYDASNYLSTTVGVAGNITTATFGVAFQGGNAGAFAFNAPVTVTGGVSGSTLSASGAVSGASLSTTGNLTVDGNTTLGNATSDTITATGRFNTDIVPSTDSARDLGTSGLFFRTAYVDTVTLEDGIPGCSLAVSTTGSFVNTANGYAVNDVQVIGAQGLAVADATGAGDVVAQLNTLLSRLRDHGLIAT